MLSWQFKKDYLNMVNQSIAFVSETLTTKGVSQWNAIFCTMLDFHRLWKLLKTCFLSLFYFIKINVTCLGYPNHPMSFLLKLWWVVQAAYWIHTIPELYFQRIKKDEWSGCIRHAAVAFAFVGLAYGFK